MKLVKPFEGPFTVLRRKMSGNYELKGPNGTSYVCSPWVSLGIIPGDHESAICSVDQIVEHRDFQERQFDAGFIEITRPVTHHVSYKKDPFLSKC